MYEYLDIDLPNVNLNYMNICDYLENSNYETISSKLYDINSLKYYNIVSAIDKSEIRNRKLFNLILSNTIKTKELINDTLINYNVIIHLLKIRDEVIFTDSKFINDIIELANNIFRSKKNIAINERDKLIKLKKYYKMYYRNYINIKEYYVKNIN
jgi:hypothetical protein